MQVAWEPRSPAEWAAFSAARHEAGQLWSDLVKRHERIRRYGACFGFKWPTAKRWEEWRRRYPGLNAQSVQQIIGEFLEAVKATGAARKTGEAVRYPRRLQRYRDVVYTNQDARFRRGCLVLPAGISGTLKIRLPEYSLPGRLIEVRLRFGQIDLVCEIPDVEPVGPSVTIGVDLGVNTLIASTDGFTTILISGREVKATVQWRNKRLASLRSVVDLKQKGSRRSKRLHRRKYKLLGKAQRRVKDAVHKATRIVADAFPGAKAFVGKPFNDAAQRLSAKQAQQVSQACGRRIIQQLSYKLRSTEEVEEHYTSQTCPVCGTRRRCGRVYKCGCGFTAPRDVVGSLNILRIGQDGAMSPSPIVPMKIVFRRPSQKYPGGSQVVPEGFRQVARRAAPGRAVEAEKSPRQSHILISNVCAAFE